jgi:hypothetical protein
LARFGAAWLTLVGVVGFPAWLVWLGAAWLTQVPSFAAPPARQIGPTLASITS